MLRDMHASFASLVNEFSCLASTSCHIELRWIAKILEKPRKPLCVLHSQRSINRTKPCWMFEPVDSARVSAAWQEETSKKSLHQRDQEMETATQTGAMELQEALSDSTETFEHE